MYMRVPRMCLVPVEVRKRQEIPWGWSQGWSWEPTLGLLQEPQVIFPAEPSLQSPQRYQLLMEVSR